MSWTQVCKADDLKDEQVKLFEVNGIKIVVANTGGVFSAIPPDCPHMEEPLAESGLCKNGVLTCTKHLWQWDTRTGKAQGAAEKDLLLYQVKQDGDDILIFVEEELTYDWDDDDDDDDD